MGFLQDSGQTLYLWLLKDLRHWFEVNLLGVVRLVGMSVLVAVLPAVEGLMACTPRGP